MCASWSFISHKSTEALQGHRERPAPRGGSFTQCPGDMEGQNAFPSTPPMGFPGGAVVKNLRANEGDTGDPSSIPGSGRSSEEGNGTPLQYSCLESSMDREAWWAAVHGVAKSQIRLSTHACTCHVLRVFLKSGSSSTLAHLIPQQSCKTDGKLSLRDTGSLVDVQNLVCGRLRLRP